MYIYIYIFIIHSIHTYVHIYIYIVCTYVGDLKTIPMETGTGLGPWVTDRTMILSMTSKGFNESVIGLLPSDVVKVRKGGKPMN